MTEKNDKTQGSAMTRASAGNDLKRFYLVFGAVAVIGIVALVYGVASKAMSAAASEPVDLEGADNLRHLVEIAQGVTLGDEDAPVSVLEFSDFMCTHCAVFNLQIRPLLEMEYVETGKAKFVHYDFPLSSNPHSFIAARAARCADDQDQYFNYQGMLYRNQIGWAMSPTTPLDTFIEYAEMLGLDTRVYESCLKSDRHAEVVTANLRLGEALGINGTPTIHVGTDMYNRRLRDYAYQTIKEAIETSLALSPPS